MESKEVALTGPFDWLSVTLRLAVHPTNPLSLCLKAEGSVCELQKMTMVMMGLSHDGVES